MKFIHSTKTGIVILLCSVVITQSCSVNKKTATTTKTTTTTSTEEKQPADEILEKHINAIGGVENWKKVNSMVQSGSMSFQGADIQMKRSIIHNTASRTDISLMGMTGYQIVTTKEGWSYMPFQGQATVEAMTADQVKDSQEELDIQGTYIDYKAKGHTAEYLGKEDVDGTECHKIKMTLKGGKTQTLYIDPTSYYLIKTLTVVNTNGQEAEVATSFSNFQKQPSGIVIPMSTTVPLGPGLNADLTIESVEINTTLDASLFKPEK
jgi:outer membrane lipoprotein-sorting protein